MAPTFITRFGRTYVPFDPDGSGGGPSTWILYAAGGTVIAATGARAAAISSAISNVIAGTATYSPTAANLDESGAAPWEIESGMPLYRNTENSVDLAIAHSDSHGLDPHNVCGLAIHHASHGDDVSYTANGVISQSDWSAVTGQVLLVPGERYFLSDTIPGTITPGCQVASGSYAVMVGTAQSATELAADIRPIAQA